MITFFGHINIDIHIYVDKLPVKGYTVNEKERNTVIGGTAANMAYMSSSLGIETALSSFTGKDFDEEILLQSGLYADITKRDRTPSCLIFSDGDGNQSVVISQGAMKGISSLSPSNNTLGIISRSDIVHFGTGEWGYYEKIARHIRENAGKRRKKVLIAFDPAQEIGLYTREDIKKAFAISDILFINNYELKILLDTMKMKYDDIAKSFKIVVITKGSDGSTIITHDEKYDIPAFQPRKIVNTTGAGDAYRAGFYYGFLKSGDVRKAGTYGSALSSLVIEGEGIIGRKFDKGILEERVRNGYRKEYGDA